MEHMESKMQDQIEGAIKDHEHYVKLQETVIELLSHRHGKLPTLGYIRDTNKSREVIGRLADLVGVGA